MARCVSTMCDLPYYVHNLMTVGTPNMGVGGVPLCYSTLFCKIVNWWVEQGIYQPLMQKMIGPAGYWRSSY